MKSKDFMAFLFFWQRSHTLAHFLHTLQKSHVIFALLAQRAFRCTKKKFLCEEHPRQLAAFFCVHLPDGFKDHFACDFCCRRHFAFRGRLRPCSCCVLPVEVGFDLLCQLQPGPVLRVSVGVHQDDTLIPFYLIFFMVFSPKYSEKQLNCTTYFDLPDFLAPFWHRRILKPILFCRY